MNGKKIKGALEFFLKKKGSQSYIRTI